MVFLSRNFVYDVELFIETKKKQKTFK